MKVTISELISVRIALEQIIRPEYTLSNALTKIEEKIKQWAENVEIVSDENLIVPNTDKTTDELPF